MKTYHSFKLAGIAAILALGLGACSKHESTEAPANGSADQAVVQPDQSASTGTTGSTGAPAAPADTTGSTGSTGTTGTTGADAVVTGTGSSSEPSAGTTTTPGGMTTDASAAGTKAGQAVDDSMLTAKVKTALMAEPGIKSLKIDVDTKNGVTTLSGTVDSDAHSRRAADLARSVEGVKSVTNQLTIKK